MSRECFIVWDVANLLRHVGEEYAQVMDTSEVGGRLRQRKQIVPEQASDKAAQRDCVA